jgi:16S rRNA (guanine966-N2)-methyltransferase
LRVIAGEARGRPLRAPRGASTRPTADRVKESLFAILAGRLPGARVLDLYAGSGALAIEALSRGAAEAVLVERAPAALACIAENLERTGFATKARVLAMPVSRALAVLAQAEAHFDLVLMDPPYWQGLIVSTLEALTRGRIVQADDLVIVEHDRREEMPDALENLACVRREAYGDTALSFYRCHSPIL